MIVFLSIFGVGFTLLVLSMIFGHDADVDVDVDVDVDAGPGGPSIFSVKMISLLLVGFGSTGFAVRVTTDSTMFMSSMGGLGGAVAMGIVGYIILRIFYTSQESSTITRKDIEGCTGTLIDAINEGGQGQVACIIRGREITYLARSKDGQAVDRGQQVRIISLTGNRVTVEPTED